MKMDRKFFVALSTKPPAHKAEHQSTNKQPISGGPNNTTPSNQWAQSISHSGTLNRAALIARENGSIDFEIKSSCTSTTTQIHAADAQSQIRNPQRNCVI
jgi:hypothetical protein